MKFVLRIPPLVRIGTFFVLVLAARQLSIATQGFNNGPILCTFRRITGMPCPFCGGTRSVGALLEGRFLDALTLNPLGYVSAILILFLVFAPQLLASLFDKSAQRWWQFSDSQRLWMGVGVFFSFWIANLPRML